MVYLACQELLLAVYKYKQVRERKQLPDVKLAIFKKKLLGTVANNFSYSDFFFSYTLNFQSMQLLFRQ